MARIYHAGAEINAGVGTLAATSSPDGVKTGIGTLTRDTAVFRSGAASWKHDSASGSPAFLVLSSANWLPAFVAANSPYYFRVYVRTTTAPNVAGAFLVLGNGTATDPICKLDSAGALTLFVANAQQGSASAAVNDGNWHCVEMSGTIVSTNWTAAELRLDGATVATWSGTQAMSASQFEWGYVANPGASKILNTDDVAVNDSTGATNNSWCGAGSVVLLAPTADSAVGAGWTGGAGGTSSLYDAVNNSPPVGVADTGTNTSQIRNATSNANSNYDATMTTYAAAGVGASDVVNAVIPWTATAAPVVTSAKLGTVGVVSNPTIANANLNAAGTSGAFWSGVAGGTFGSGWKWSAGTMTNAPSVTVGTAPVMRITQVTASTRIADVCFMGIYVDYTPAAAAATPSLAVPTTVPTRYLM